MRRAAIVLLAALAACSKSSPQAGSSTGSTSAGVASSTGSAMGSGTGRATGTGSSAATSGGSTGGSGGTTGCADPSTLPAVPQADLEVSDTCASPPAACQMPPDGTTWALTDLCLSDADLGGVTAKVQALCSAAYVSADFGSSAEGGVRLLGGALTVRVHATRSVAYTIPNACAGCQCSFFESELQSEGLFEASCSPVCGGSGECTCYVDSSVDTYVTGAYAVSDGGLALDGGFTFTACATDAGLLLVDASARPAFGSAELTASAPAPERCNGLDDDLNGLVDDDIRECPASCGASGVCAATVATCGGAQGWVCDYPASHQTFESTCDGLDNDCNGTVDDEPAATQSCQNGGGPLFGCVDGGCACTGLVCGGSCTDPKTDLANCGACGNACASGASCDDGGCLCPPGAPDVCGGACVDMAVSAQNCGGCGAPCPAACDGRACQGATAIAVNTSSCALLADGAVRCWGENDYGGCGTGTLDFVPTPAPTAVPPSAALAVGCVATQAGEVYCWGDNEDQQIPGGGGIKVSNPTHIAGVTDARQVAQGDQHVCALLGDGTVTCWGLDTDGELGDGQPTGVTRHEPPTQVPGLSGVARLAAGGQHTCAVLADGGSVLCWGTNYFGESGGPSGGSFNTPHAVPNLTQAVALCANQWTTCAALDGGSAYCWGMDDHGQLGDGATAPSHATPVQVAGITSAVGVSCGQGFGCVLLADGTVRCFGADDRGQAGDLGTSGDRLVPTQVVGLTDATQISSGYLHSCAVRTDGTVWCWGNDTFGGLGLADAGSSTNALARPVEW